MLSLGIIKKNERQKISFKIQENLKLVSSDPGCVATIKFRDQEVGQQYEVRIVEDQDAPEVSNQEAAE